MALWGMAYSLCPNTNRLEIPAEQMSRAQMAIRLAELNVGESPSLERSLITELATRCKVAETAVDRQQLNRDYADVTIDRSCYCRLSASTDCCVTE